jgi:hypothetical protein
MIEIILYMLLLYIYIYQAVKYTVLFGYLLVSAPGECCIGMINLIVLVRYLRRGLLGSEEDRYYCTMLHLFDDLWLDKIIPKNNDEGRVIYGNLENKINTLYWPVENSIPKNNDRSRL